MKVNTKKYLKDVCNTDKKIVELLEKRINQITSLDPDEADLRIRLKENQAAASSVVSSELLKKLYNDLYDNASNYIRIKVAFLGPFATNTHQAAVSVFGKNSELFPQFSINDIFSSVEKGTVRFGVVPVENSIEGSINVTHDLLTNTELNIYGEKTINITHHLIGTGTLNNIKEIYSHPQILAQCRNWLRLNCPFAHLTETSSSSAALEKLKNNKNRAAIGTLLASELSGYPVIKENIQDFKSNKTRFFIISKEKRAAQKLSKTSLFFLCQDKPGALVEALKVFKQYGINLTKIESRPSKRRDWEYYFFVDLLGHENDEIVKKALQKLHQKTLYIKILGSYPVC